ncbi:hypothetical protein KUTeg_015137 [Tegillarca granosa]|uniref:Uncharacterized protein n=1 Tax=Tegillarca granosa TaxID=220873 RepID=A0ABQ9EP93_TEGGR|nr:hypothetical protein KUTeg_015137 [Tegillarca granosa]
MPRLRTRRKQLRPAETDVRPRRRPVYRAAARREQVQDVAQPDATMNGEDADATYNQPIDIKTISEEITRNVLQRIQDHQPIQAIGGPVNNNEGNTEHVNFQIASTLHELGQNVQNNTKLKIINNEYIDLGILISKINNPDDES